MSGTDTAQSSAQVDPAYRRKPPTALLDQIEQLQRDGLLLLDHLTKRPGRRFTQSETTIPTENDDKAKAGQPTDAVSPQAVAANALSFAANALSQAASARNAAGQGVEIEDLSLKPLTLSPKEVADEEHGLRNLVLLVDTLARMADPVTPTTIENSRRRWSKCHDGLILLVLIIAFAFSVALLWRVDEARALITQVQQAQQAANQVYSRLRLLKPEEHFISRTGAAQSNEAQTAILFYALCDIDTNIPHLAPKSPEAVGLCSELAQRKKQENMLFGRLGDWNCSLTRDVATFWIAPLIGGRRADVEPRTAINYEPCTDRSAATACSNSTDCVARDQAKRQETLRDWQNSEFRATAMLSLLGNHLLPALLALLGACTYLLRLRFRQRIQSTLEHLGWAGVARLLMPTVLGGLISVVWSPGNVLNPTNVTIQDLSLSLTLIAFLLGYAFDPALEWLEGKIRETFLKLNGETKEVKVQ